MSLSLVARALGAVGNTAKGAAQAVLRTGGAGFRGVSRGLKQHQKIRDVVGRGRGAVTAAWTHQLSPAQRIAAKRTAIFGAGTAVGSGLSSRD